jgi:glycosyltransferase involved in cell wall biosynthesis
MKILFVAPWIPSVQRPRSLALMQMLSKQHQLYFAGLCSSHDERAAAAQLPVDEFRLATDGPRRALLRAANSYARGRSLQQGYAENKYLVRSVGEMLTRIRPDAIHLNVYRSISVLDSVVGRGVPIIFDLDEFRSEYYRQLSAGGSTAWWRLVGGLEAKRMQMGERRVVQLSRQVLVSGPRELERLPHSGVSVVRSPYRPAAIGSTRPRRRSILFVGRLSYEANRAALRWFVSECWPQIAAANSDVTLAVVGANPPQDVRRLIESLPRADLHANVTDVNEYYQSAMLSVVPVFRGTGVQMKLIEALGSGVPVVTSKAAASAAGVTSGRHVVALPQAADCWIESITALLCDPSRAAELGASGRNWAEQHHSWGAVWKQLTDAYSRGGVSL